MNVTPLGSVPPSLKLGAGNPVTVTVNVPAVPTVNVVLFALVIAGAWLTVRVKLCTALLPTPLLALKLIGYVPKVPAAGVPLNVLVAELNVTPLGSVPVCVTVGAGTPVVVTVKVAALPTVKVVAFALVIAGG